MASLFSKQKKSTEKSTNNAVWYFYSYFWVAFSILKCKSGVQMCVK